MPSLSLYIKIELVLAVPDPPISKTDFWHKGFLIYLGWFRIALIRNSALNESTVGNNNWLN